MKTQFYILLSLSLLIFYSLAISEKAYATEIDSVTGIVVNVSCFNESDGQISLTVYGGTPPFTYNWNDGSHLVNRSNLSPNTYVVTVHDDDGHSKVASFLITQPDPMYFDAEIIPVSCYGSNDGSINMLIQGGTPPFSYLWSTGNTTGEIEDLTAGAYSVTVTDFNGCQLSGDVVVPGSEATFQVLATVMDVSCFGFTNGSVTITVTGGSAPYQFLWNDGSGSQNRTNLPASSYYVTVTDALGSCSATPAIVTQPEPLGVTETIIPVNCYGANTGSIDISVTGGTFPYFYLWSDFTTNQDLNNLYAGNYSLLITDNAGCTFNAGPYILSDPPALMIEETQTEVSCFSGNDGSIDITVSGGIPPYSYSWSNGETTQDLMNITSGWYTLLVTDALNCQSTQLYFIEEPGAILPNAVVTPISCWGQANGSINLSTTGGQPPLTYSWSNGSTTQDISNLQAGNYTVTITDQNECTNIATYTIIQPGYLWFGGNVTPVTCPGGNDGWIQVGVFGGNPPYTYLWNDGSTSKNRINLAAGAYTMTVTDSKNCHYTATLTIIDPDDFSFNPVIKNVSCNGGNDGAINLDITGGTPPYNLAWDNGEFTEDLEGLSIGTYTISVTDALGCFIQETFTVTQPEVLTLSGIVTDVVCPAGNDGTITTQPAGGTAPYSYSWNDGNTEAQRDNLIAGIYSLLVTDNLGCTVSDIFTVEQPDLFIFNEIIYTVSCNGLSDGVITIAPTGGTPPYTYIWSTGDVTETIDNLAAGSYAVLITDNIGCKINPEFVVSEPAVLQSSVLVKDISCFEGADGEINLTTSGGTQPYSWLWSNEATTEDLNNLVIGTYYVTITDINNCIQLDSATLIQPVALEASGEKTNNLCHAAQSGTITLTITGGTEPYSYSWSDGSTLGDRIDLPAGNYAVTITDALGCEVQLDFTITEPDAVETAETITDVSCKGLSDGSILLVVTGGTPNYTFEWSTGSSAQDIFDLEANTYFVTITDANNCATVFTYEVTEPQLLTLSGITTDIDCNGNNNGSIVLSVSGGTPGYSYSWNTGETVANRSDLAPGTYKVTVTDSHSCADSATFIINQPDSLLISGVVTDISCFAAGNGAVNITVTGGTPDYIYLWSTGDNTTVLNNLTPATYSVTVTDALGCQTTETYSLSDPVETVILLAVQDSVSCHGGSDGGINLTVTGGTPEYSYLWNTGFTLKDLANVPVGTYMVTVTDADQNCSVISAVVLEPDTLSVSFVLEQPSCFSYTDGNILLTVEGGTPPYSYLWSEGSITENLSLIGSGNYTVTITDANHCEFVSSTFLGEPAALAFTYEIGNVSCNGSGDGEISIISSGGTPNYSWNWSSGESVESIASLVPDTYFLTITDDNGCSLTADFTITEPDPLLIITDEIVPVLCHGGNDGKIYLSVTGGTLEYSYLWSDGITIQDRTDLTAGNYSLTITDSQGCTVTESFAVTETFTLVITPLINDAICFEGSSGSIELSVSGGTEAYNFLWNDDYQEQNRYDLPAGTYSVLVTDANECSETASFIVGQAEEIIISGVITNNSCFGNHEGRIVTSATGGSGNYSWLWFDGSTQNTIDNLLSGTYSVTVTDNAGCTASASFEVTEPASVSGMISPGMQILYCSGASVSPISFIPDNYPAASVSYQWSRDKVAEVSGIPANGTGIISGSLINNTFVSQTVTFTIAVQVNGCPAGTFTSVVHVAGSFQLSLTYQPIQCYGDTVTVVVEAIGGVPPYTGQQTVQLTAGTYSFTVTDHFGCTATETLTLTQPPPIIVSGVVSPAYCSNNTNAGIDISVGGGIEPYTYLWSDGSTLDDRNSLAVGTYHLTVTDATGCHTVKTFTVGSFYIAPMGAIQATPVGCYGQDNPIYFYLSGSPPWSLEYTDGTTVFPINNITNNIHIVYVNLTSTKTFTLLWVNDLHCTGTVTSLPQTMTVVPPPTITIDAPEPICQGETSLINVHMTGTPPFSLTWFDGTSHTVNNINSTTYIITSTPATTRQYSIQAFSDVYCPASVLTQVVTQTVYPLPTAHISGNPTVCSGINVPLLIQLTGAPPWEIKYYDGTAITTVSNINTSNYTIFLAAETTSFYSLVSVRDIHCYGTVSGQASVLVHPRPTATWNGPDSACFNSTIAMSIILTGTPPWNLTWNDGTSSHFIQGISFSPYTILANMTAAKTFSVMQLSDAFCQANNPSHFGQPKLVTVHQLPTATLTGQDVSCIGIGGSLKAFLTGSPPWSITWYEGTLMKEASGIQTSPFEIPIDPMVPTTYFLSSVSDAFCQGSVLGSPINISVLPSPIVQFEGLSEENSICTGSSLAVTTLFLGGVPPFTISYLDASGLYHSIANLENGSIINFSPPNIPGNFWFHLLTVSSNNGCEVLLNRSFIINVIPAPSINAGNDTTITLGNSLTLMGSITGGIPPYEVLWQPSDYLNDPSLLNPVSTPLSSISYTLQIRDSIGCLVTDQVNITVDMSRNIFGYINYDNSIRTPMNNVKVKVKNTAGSVIDSTFTDGSGYYEFTDLPNGNFSLHETTEKEFGGVNATDALLVLRHFVGIQQLSTFRKNASDVDGSGFLNALDALSIAKRFTGQTSGFVVPDWYFKPVNFTIPTSIAQYDIDVLCAGDANGSYIPEAKIASGLTLSSFGELNISGDKPITIPLTVDRPIALGAMSLNFRYPGEWMTIKNVTRPGGNPVLFNAEGNELRISWYSLESELIGEYEEILRIDVELNNYQAAGESLLSIGSGSEMADAAAIPLTEVGLLIPKLITSNSASLDLSVNIPNPFSYQTQISYFIPSDGNIKLTVFDALGKEVAVPVNEYHSSGTASVILDGSALPEGIYLYRLDFSNGKEEKSLMRKMILIR